MDEDAPQFVEEDAVIPDAMLDQIGSDPVNLDHRMAAEVDPDSIDETQLHPDYFYSETVAEDLRELERRQRRVLMRILRSAQAREEVVADAPSPVQSALQLERFGTPRHRRARENRWQAHA